MPNRSKTEERPELSVVVPVSERTDDLAALHRQLVAAVQAHTQSYEFVYVVDGPNQPIIDELNAAREGDSRVRLCVLNRWFGEATALAAGLEQARGSVILTSGSYFQVEVAEITAALDRFDPQRVDLLLLGRAARKDSVINRAQGRVFHALVAWLTGTSYQDLSSGVRIMTRDVAREVRLYGDLHRFLPLFAFQRGFRVEELGLTQHEKDTNLRVRSPGVYLRRLLDVLTLFFLFKFTKKPLRFFGIIGTVLGACGFGVTGWLALTRILGTSGPIAGRPALIYGALLVVLGVQLFSIGLLGELIIFTHARSLKDYHIQKILE